MCINIPVDMYQGDSCDDDLRGNESLIQEVELDADQVSRLPRGLLESLPQDSNNTDVLASTPKTESEKTDKVIISLQYSYDLLSNNNNR